MLLSFRMNQNWCRGLMLCFLAGTRSLARAAVVLAGLGAALASGIEPQVAATLKAEGGNLYQLKEGGSGISFQDWKLDEDGWKALESVPDLKSVTIGTGRQFGDAQLARLCGIKTIETLFVNVYGGTEEGLSALAKLPNLRHFGADHSPFTGAGLLALKDAKNFRSVRFGGCPFNDDGLRALGELSQLKEANISHVAFTSAGFPNFAKMSGLEKLAISPNFSPYYTGADLAHLSGLKNLQTLVVSEMALPWENGLDHLKGLQLKRIEFHDCRISDADLQKLEAALPGATIVRDYSFDEKYKRWDAELERRKKTKS